VVMKPVISIVDDDESVRDGMMNLMCTIGFIAHAFPGGRAFLECDYSGETSCLIADVQMPGMSGLELHERLVSSGNKIPTILITGFPNNKDRARAQRSGVICYLAKPVLESELLDCISIALGNPEPDRAHP
jgi:FixJ family two-component response regulator